MTADLFRRPAWAPVPCSRLGFGGAAIGLSGYLGDYDASAAATREASVAAIRAAADAGITYFDTAPGYGHGLSESLFGEALEDRREVVVASKCAPCNADAVRGSVEASLVRLRRSRIDLLQIHGTSLDAEAVRAILTPGGMLSAMVGLREEGLVGALGFTSEDNNCAVFDLIACGGFDAMQLAYNVVLQHPLEPTRPFGSLLEARRRGLFSVTMRSLTSGVFQRWMKAVRPDDTYDYTAALLQFVLSNELVDVALVGMRTVEEVQSSTAIWRDLDGRVDVHKLWQRY